MSAFYDINACLLASSLLCQSDEWKCCPSSVAGGKGRDEIDLDQ